MVEASDPAAAQAADGTSNTAQAADGQGGGQGGAPRNTNVGVGAINSGNNDDEEQQNGDDGVVVHGDAVDDLAPRTNKAVEVEDDRQQKKLRDAAGHEDAVMATAASATAAAAATTTADADPTVPPSGVKADGVAAVVAMEGAVPTGDPPTETATTTTTTTVQPGESNASSATQQSQQRTLLTQTYSPHILPTDTSLSSARTRLRRALEQMYTLRKEYTEQTYERYRVLMRPLGEGANGAPADSIGGAGIEKRLREIESDPSGVLDKLRKENDKRKSVMEGQAPPPGGGVSGEHHTTTTTTTVDYSYTGEDGLHLVILPEDNLAEYGLDPKKYNQRSPVDPDTGRRHDGMSQAGVAATLMLLDGVRRSRGMPVETTEYHHHHHRRSGSGGHPRGFDYQRNYYDLRESESMEKRDSFGSYNPYAPSPTPSNDSHGGMMGVGGVMGGAGSTGTLPSQQLQYQRKSSQNQWLSMSPAAEQLQPDGTINTTGKYTAVQSALMARGVGSNEMHRDYRFNSMHQRVIPPEFYETVLPPLLGARAIGREGERRVKARRAIRSVIEEIMKRGNDDDSVDGGVEEIGFMKQMRAKSLEEKEKNGETKAPPQDQPAASNSTPSVDPMLAFSVMKAVGLVKDKDNNNTKAAGGKVASGDAETLLGLGGLTSTESVSQFVSSFSATSADGNKRAATDSTTTSPRPKKSKLMEAPKTKEDNAALHIRGGGGDDEEEEPQKPAPRKRGRPRKNQPKVAAGASKKEAETKSSEESASPPAEHPTVQSAQPMFPSSVNAMYNPMAMDAYQSAALAQQLGVGSAYMNASSYPRSQLGGSNADGGWVRINNSSTLP
eukprot:g11598.t1 g11598   contig6:181812-184325(+)